MWELFILQLIFNGLVSFFPYTVAPAAINFTYLSPIILNAVQWDGNFGVLNLAARIFKLWPGLPFPFFSEMCSYV